MLRAAHEDPTKACQAHDVFARLSPIEDAASPNIVRSHKGLEPIKCAKNFPEDQYSLQICEAEKYVGKKPT
jgi:hypothetical protein